MDITESTTDTIETTTDTVEEIELTDETTETIEITEEETESIEISESSSDTLEIEDNVTVGGTSNYEKLNNKPSINSIELVGNKTSDDLCIQSKMDTLTNLEIYNLLS